MKVYVVIRLAQCVDEGDMPVAVFSSKWNARAEYQDPSYEIHEFEVIED